MADTGKRPPALSGSSASASSANASGPKRAPRLRGLLISAALLSVAIASAAGWWFVGTRAWTNGQDVSIADREARLREVLWKPPVPLDGNFNTVDQEYEPTVSPDSTELYFVRGKAGKEQAGQADIFVSYRKNNAWTKPVAVEGVNSEYDDLGPRLTSDGKYLFFYSNRPGGLGEYDIWASARTADGWGKPFNLGPSINSEFNEYSPSPTPDGKRLIFSTNRKAASLEQKENWRATIRQSGVGDYDLFVADLDESATAAIVSVPATAQAAPVTQPVADIEKKDVTAEAVTPAINLEAIAPTTAPTTAPAPEALALIFKPAVEIAGVNTPFHEGASCLSPFGDFLYFSSNRPGGQGKFDIYRARVQPDGSFANVENLGKQINSPENETDPQLAMGGFHLLFSSDRPGSQGGYDLLSSDSVEVFAKRQGHPLPQLGWSWWVLLASIVALIPLLLLLRGWNDHKLNVLQKCLLVSVMLHVLLTIGLSFYVVSVDVIHYARKELGMEVAVSLDVPVEQQIGMSIRSQAGNSDLPVGEGLAAPSPTQQVNSAANQANADLPDAFDVGVPGSQAAPTAGEMVVTVRAPQITVPTPGHPVEVSVAAVSPDAMGKAPAIEITPAIRRVSQNEVKVEAVTPNVEITRVTGIGEKIAGAAAEQVDVSVERSAPGAQESIAQQAVMNPRSTAAMVAPEVVQAPAAPTVPQRTSVDVTGPAIGQLQKVTSAAAENPQALEQAMKAPRQAIGTSVDATGAARPVGTSDTKIPAADIAAKSSLADAAVGTAGPRVSPLDQVALVPAVKVTADAANTGGGPTIVGPRRTMAPLASGLPDAPKVEETAIGTIRQGAAGGTPLNAGDGALEAALAAGVNKGLAPTQQGNDTSMVQAPGAAPRVASGAGKATGPTVAVAAPQGVTGGTAGVEVGSAIKGSASKVSGPDAGPMSPSDATGAGPIARANTGAAATGGAGSAQTTDLKVGASRPTTQPSSVIDSAVAGAPGSRVGAISPTAMVKPSVQPAIGGGPKTDNLGAGLIATKLGKVGGGAGDAAKPSVETTVASARVKSGQGGDISGGIDAAQVATVAPAAAGATAGTGQSLALSSTTGPRKVTGIGAGGTTAAPNLTGGFAGPELAGPKVGATARAGKVGGPDVEMTGPAGGSREPGGSIVSKAGGGKGGTGLGATGPGGINVGTDVVRPISPGGPGTGPIALGSSTGGVRVRGPAIDTIDGPKVSIAKPRLAAPEAMFQRSLEARKPVLEKMGGTQKSEEAVDRALSYLARNQEPDGRWTLINGDNKPGQRGESSPHDTANTGLALLAFLANDHTPVDPGPYRDVVAGGVKWLIKAQEPSGDLRGKHKGGGSDQGNMYDQGIATFALAEAALMTSDPEITAAAFKGADFIVKAQHKETGGWRYSPGESGDTSVFGWQVMALHSAELVGYKLPPDCKAGMLKYIQICSQGQHKGLGGYQPGGGATAPMTAELLFCRIMLGQEITPAAEKEVGEFLTQRLAEQGTADFYCWYYTSLSLIQLQNDAWRKWNERARDTLISMQKTGGDNDGVWDAGLWRDRGGRVFNTSLGALTLQVYYRYAPLRATEKDAAKP